MVLTVDELNSCTPAAFDDEVQILGATRNDELTLLTSSIASFRFRFVQS